MFNKSFESVIDRSIRSFDFEKLSDLNKEQFSELMSTIINNVVNSSEFEDCITNTMTKNARRIR